VPWTCEQEAALPNKKRYEAARDHDVSEQNYESKIRT